MTAQPTTVHKPSTWFLAGVGFLVLSSLSVLQSVLTHRPAAWGGLLPFFGLGYSCYGFIRWWKALHHPILSPQVRRTFSIGWTVFGGVLVAVGAVISSGPNGGQSTTGAGFFLAGLAAVMGYWAILFGLLWGRAISAEMKVASTPVPPPGEIAALLEDEWGRLTSRKNEALLATGLSLGALYLMDHNLH